jgi:hypothetical protein
MQTQQIEPAKVRELQRLAKEAASRLERDNARAELRETVKEAARRDYEAKRRHLVGNFA